MERMRLAYAGGVPARKWNIKRKTMKQLASLDDLTGQYDVFFCDVWGVVHNGVAAHPAAVAALKRARAKGVTVILRVRIRVSKRSWKHWAYRRIPMTVSSPPAT
jgi:hypothetical protein